MKIKVCLLATLLLLAGCNSPEATREAANKPPANAAPSSANKSALSEQEEDLFAAATAGDTQWAKSLLDQGVNVNARQVDGSMPLTEAVYAGHTQTVKLLLDYGADPSLKKKDGASALTLTGKPEILALFEGINDLVAAASKGDNKTVKALLDKGVSVNGKNEFGQLALTEAVWNGHTETVKLLLERGADPNMKKSDGASPLSLAKDQKMSDLLKQGAAKPSASATPQTQGSPAK